MAEYRGRYKGTSHAGVRDRSEGAIDKLVRRAEAGEEVDLTRHGQAAVRLVRVKAVRTGNPGARCWRR